jgi:hypothetical protein
MAGNVDVTLREHAPSTLPAAKPPVECFELVYDANRIERRHVSRWRVKIVTLNLTVQPYVIDPTGFITRPTFQGCSPQQNSGRLIAFVNMPLNVPNLIVPSDSWRQSVDVSTSLLVVVCAEPNQSQIEVLISSAPDEIQNRGLAQYIHRPNE